MTAMTPLRKARQGRGLTLTEVAKATGIDPGNLSRLETLKQSATAEVAEKLVAYFGADVLSELQVLYPRRFMPAAAGEVAAGLGEPV